MSCATNTHQGFAARAGRTGFARRDLLVPKTTGQQAARPSDCRNCSRRPAGTTRAPGRGATGGGTAVGGTRTRHGPRVHRVPRPGPCHHQLSTSVRGTAGPRRRSARSFPRPAALRRVIPVRPRRRTEDDQRDARTLNDRGHPRDVDACADCSVARRCRPVGGCSDRSPDGREMKPILKPTRCEVPTQPDTGGDGRRIRINALTHAATA